MTAFARSARLALTFVLSLSATPLFAQSLYDGAPFSADPKALLAAAEKVDAKQQSVVYLLDEASFSFEATAARSRCGTRSSASPRKTGWKTPARSRAGGRRGTTTSRPSPRA